MFGVFGLDLAQTFGGDEVELEDGPITLKVFLEVLTEQSGGTVRFNEVHTDSDTDFYFALLNGNEVKSLAHGIDTQLADGDEVSLAPVDLLFSGG